MQSVGQLKTPLLFCLFSMISSCLPTLQLPTSGIETLALLILPNDDSSQAENAVAPPVFSLPAGTYNSDQSIEISTVTPGATIYYTIDGSTPTTSSSVYSSLFPVSIAGNGANTTINAFAVKSGMTDSSVASAAYTISYPVVVTPTFSPAAGTYDSDQSVTISTVTPSATIYYTDDGSTPTTSSTQYSAPVSIAGNGTNMTINAFAVKSGMTDSSVASAAYTISYPVVATPTFSPAAGTYNTDQLITISTVTTGATIYYTIDGSTPTISSTQYLAPISVAGNGTNKIIKAIAVKSGMADSSEASAVYTISYPVVVTPTFSPVAGTYNTNQSVTISTVTYSATIYYTTDTTTPTTSSTQYFGSIPISGDGNSITIKAIAVKLGMTDSAVATAVYTISYPKLPVLKTGQITVYATNDDGDLQIGTARSYTNNGDGTVTDNATGLIWQKCSMGQADDASCTGAASSVNWTNADNYCSTTLNLASKTWRLPTKKELESLPDYGASSGAIDITYFPNTPGSEYWSATVYAPNSANVWTVSFADGYTYFQNKSSNSSSVRCVSSPPTSNIVSFTDNGNDTITDNTTGLVWQKCSVGQSAPNCSGGAATTPNWSLALATCSGLGYRLAAA